MKTTPIFKAVSLLLLTLLITGNVASQQDSLGKITFILGDEGDVTILHADQQEWVNAKLYQPVFNGDQIMTRAESRCEIKLNDKSLIRIGENSSIILSKTNLTNLNSEVTTGRVWANIKTLKKKSSFEMRTPTAVCSIRGTIYRVDADSSTKVLVYEGAVDVGPLTSAHKDSAAPKEQKIYQPPHEVPGPTQVPGPFQVSLDQWVRIVAGYQIEVRQDGKYYQSKINSAIDTQDDWVKWNLERDANK
ncbi:MAG: FecR family protein [Candidatus Zhuqueibacterota bacterium]